MKFKKTWIISFLFIFLIPASTSVFADEDSLKVYNLSGQITAVHGRALFFLWGSIYLKDLYLRESQRAWNRYATEISPAFPFKSDFREVRYSSGEEYRAEGDTADVYIYRKKQKSV
jgi:hypothetical protein